MIAVVSVIGSIVLFTQLGSIGDIIDINTGANYGDLVRVTGTTWGVITLIGGIFLSMGMYAVGEFLKLMIDIEHNTRNTHLAIRLRRAANREEKRDLAPVAPSWKPHKPPLPAAKSSWNEGAFWQRAARRKRLVVDDSD